MQINKLWYLFRGVAIGRNYGTARVAGFVYFWEETKSTYFRLVKKQVISVLLAHIAFITHFTDCFTHWRTRVWAHDLKVYSKWSFLTVSQPLHILLVWSRLIDRFRWMHILFHDFFTIICDICFFFLERLIENISGNQIQSNLVISNSLISNCRLSRSENLVPVSTWNYDNR